MMKRLILILVLFCGIYCTLTACDMSAVITKQGVSLADYQSSADDFNYADFASPVDYLTYVMSTSNSTSNNDGYGIAYYPDNRYKINESNYWYKYVTSSSVNHIYYNGNVFNQSGNADTFDEAEDAVFGNESNAAIVMCHARNASSNPFAPGNHPFRMDANNRTYTFMHNGFVSTTARTYMINEINIIHPLWFEFHTPNYQNFANSAFPSCWIDSEVLFNYLMCMIEEHDFNVYNGMLQGLKNLEPYMKLSTNVVNFVFSDGQKLFAFRSTPLAGYNSSYNLSFKDVANKFQAVRTGRPTAGESMLMPFEMVVLSRDSKPERYPDFLKLPPDNTDDIGDNNPNNRVHRIRPIINASQMNINISFNLEEAAQIKLKIYNSKGQLIRRLADRYFPKGAHTISWNGLNDIGNAVVRGVYFVEIQNNKQRIFHKILYLKR